MVTHLSRTIQAVEGIEEDVAIILEGLQELRVQLNRLAFLLACREHDHER